MNSENDPKEELLQRHKKEKKELQGRIQGLKKTATKGDKKKKKEVQEEIAKLEMELTHRHDAELLNFEMENRAKAEEKGTEEEVTEGIDNITVGSERRPKVSKAQKRRDKKAAEQKEREKYIQEQEIENESGLRQVETRTISEILKRDGLMIYDIEADGNCLYNAVDHQLRMRAMPSFGVNQLRAAVRDVMKSNRSEYMPFLCNPETGDMMTDDEFDRYCDKVANTTNWGGQVELRALSHVVRRPIKVVQASGPPLIMGEEYSDGENLVVCYHRHMYRLGEHYNSVQAYVGDED